MASSAISWHNASVKELALGIGWAFSNVRSDGTKVFRTIRHGVFGNFYPEVGVKMKETGMDTLERPDWDEYFMEMADFVSRRTTCLRRAVGAVIVKDHRILATGYNGAPSGLTHCGELGCLREQLGVPSGQRHELCRALHAEQNAIITAARYGVNIDGASIYVNTQPCVVCAKMIINSGIREIVYKNPYPDELSMSMLEESGIALRVYGKADPTEE